MLRKGFGLMMMGTVVRTIWCIPVMFFLCSISSADVPDSINYQGKLTTASGGCLDDTVQMTFTIYADVFGTTAEWSETQTQVEVKEGIFNVLLGSVSPLPASIFDGSAKYLGVQVESDPEMTPLKPMVSVAYAYRARSTSAAGGWVDDGTVVRLEDSTDSVGIGTATPTDKLDVSGNIKASGTITSGSSITIDGATDKITASSGTIDFDNENIVTTGKATIGPGHTNTGAYAFVAGRNNLAGGTAEGHSTVGGGENNTASGNHSTIAGGRNGISSHWYSTVGGGYDNTASGDCSTVPGGVDNTASGSYSFAAGHRAKANHGGVFVWADRTNADFASSAINQFNVRASGGTRIYSNSGLTAGVTLAAGASAWASVSHSSLKRNIRPVDGKEILVKLAQLRINRWSYKSQDPSIEHIGAMAEDFYTLFGLGEDDKTISSIDPAGIALAGIKELAQQNQELRQIIEELRQRIAELEKAK